MSGLAGARASFPGESKDCDDCLEAKWSQQSEQQTPESNNNSERLREEFCVYLRRNNLLRMKTQPSTKFQFHVLIFWLLFTYTIEILHKQKYISQIYQHEPKSIPFWGYSQRRSWNCQNVTSKFKIEPTFLQWMLLDGVLWKIFGYIGQLEIVILVVQYISRQDEKRRRRTYYGYDRGRWDASGRRLGHKELFSMDSAIDNKYKLQQEMELIW